MKDKEPQMKAENSLLFGLEPDMSLLSVNFATGENPYLNEHNQEETEEDQEE
jgi:hypothetical protein